MSKNVVVEIVNQPRSVERFRYESEKRPNRSNLAINPRTNASIRVLNYTGPVTVVVSCVTTEKPYRQHPNILVGEDCKRGVCKIDFKTDKSDPTVYTFNNMTIQCIKKVDIEKSLTEREKCNVDPFKKGFKHKKDKTFKPGVRLCFQVFTGSGDKFTPVHPIVSDIIRGKDNLEICDISDTTSPTTGAKKIIVFCSKVSKGDIKVRFYRENENAMVEWEALVQKPIVVHRQAAIVFDTPAYETNDIMEPVDVLLELVRPSDGKRSEPARSFRYVPDPLNVFNLIRKKEQKIMRSEVLFQYIEQRGDEKQSLAKTQQLNFKPNIPIVPNIPPMNHNIPPIVPNIPPMNHNNSPMNHKVPPMNTNVSPMNTNVTPMNTNNPPMNHNVPLMNSNVPPMNTNQYFNTSTTTRPPATQSNLMSNFYRHDEAPINGQSVPHQTTHFDNRRFSQDQIQHHSAQSVRCQHGGERSPLQVNQFHHRYHPHGSLQLQPSNIEPMITTQSHNDNACNPSHGQLQQYQPLSYHQTYPSHGQSQPQNIHSELQSSSNHQKHSHNASQTFHPAQNSRQPQFNSYLQHQQEQQQYYQQEQQQYYQQEQQQYYQQEQQQCYQQEQQQYYQQEHHHQQEQQHYIQSNFQDMPANSEYGKYLSSAAPYCPIPSFYTEHEQSVYANNFVSEGNIENASNTYIHY